MIDPQLRDLYQEVILDHGRNPRNCRRPEHANCEARGNNPICGDRVTVYLDMDDDGIIRDAAFEGRGCAISMASASMMTELLKGRSKPAAEALFRSFHALCTGEDEDQETGVGADPDDLERLQVLAGVRDFPVRVKCATLPWHTMQAAVNRRGEGLGTEDVTTEH